MLFIVHVFKCSMCSNAQFSDHLLKLIAIISKAQCYCISLWEANNVCACFCCKNGSLFLSLCTM